MKAQGGEDLAPGLSMDRGRVEGGRRSLLCEGTP